MPIKSQHFATMHGQRKKPALYDRFDSLFGTNADASSTGWRSKRMSVGIDVAGRAMRHGMQLQPIVLCMPDRVHPAKRRVRYERVPAWLPAPRDSMRVCCVPERIYV